MFGPWIPKGRSLIGGFTGRTGNGIEIEINVKGHQLNRNELPFRLSEGAQLADLLIPWGTDFADITKYGDPSVKQMEDSRHFTWPGVSFLGLVGDARACFMQREPDNPYMHRDAYHLFLPDLHCISLDVTPTPDTNPENRLRSAFSHMKSHFGPATFCYPEYTKSLPSFFWEFDNIFLSCSLTYGDDSVSIGARHSTVEHQRELATFDKPHPGARSDFVKWNVEW